MERTTRGTTKLSWLFNNLSWMAIAAGMPAGCARPADAAANPVTVEARNQAVARRWSEELFGAGRLDVADEIVAPDYVRHDPGDPVQARGPDGVKRLVTLLRTMLPDLRIEVQDMIAAGDRVVSRYVATATDTRGYMGLPATGKVTHTPAIQIFRLAGGKIVESWAARDDLGVLIQLGHLPAPGTPALRALLARSGGDR